MRVLPRFEPPAVVDLGAALAGAVDLMNGDPYAADTFVLDAAAVRAPLERFSSVLLAGRSMRAQAAELAAPDFAPVQLPRRAATAGRACPRCRRPNRGRRLSLLLCAPDLGGTGTTVAGLFVDEWNEALPDPAQSTGFTYHQEAPSAAPRRRCCSQCRPTPRAHEPRRLEAILLETIEMAKLRMVDLDALQAFGGVAPASSFAFDTANALVSTDFTVAT